MASREKKRGFTGAKKPDFVKSAVVRKVGLPESPE